MAIQTATEVGDSAKGADPNSWRTGEPINSSEYGDLVKECHKLWCFSGTYIEGLKEPFETSSTSFTQANDLSGRDLTSWQAFPFFKKLDKNGDYAYEFFVRGRDAAVKATADRINSDGTTTNIDSVTVGIGGTITTKSSSSGFAESKHHDFGGSSNSQVPVRFEISVKLDTDATEARMENFYLIEYDFGNDASFAPRLN